MGRPASQSDHFCNWTRENLNLVYYGQTFRKWIDIHSKSQEYQKLHIISENREKPTRVRGIFFSLYSLKVREGRAERALEQHIAKFLKSFVHTVDANLRLAIVRNGQVVGLVPAETQKGDIFFLIRHAILPIILCQHDDGRYRLVDETVFYPLRADSPMGQNPWDNWVKDKIMSYVPQEENACQSFCIY
jgi:hypothetical protein